MLFNFNIDHTAPRRDIRIDIKSTDRLQVIGNCDTPAEIIPVIRTQVELAGDKWGSFRRLMCKFENKKPNAPTTLFVIP